MVHSQIQSTCGHRRRSGAEASTPPHPTARTPPAHLSSSLHRENGWASYHSNACGLRHHKGGTISEAGTWRRVAGIPDKCFLYFWKILKLLGRHALRCYLTPHLGMSWSRASGREEGSVRSSRSSCLARPRVLSGSWPCKTLALLNFTLDFIKNTKVIHRRFQPVLRSVCCMESL